MFEGSGHTFRREEPQLTLFAEQTALVQQEAPTEEEEVYDLRVRVRIVSAADTQVLLSVVVRGEQLVCGEGAEHTLLLEAASAAGASRSIDLSAALRCAPLGRVRTVDVGDWAGVCGAHNPEPVHVYVEHADIQRVCAKDTSAERLYFHRWLPARENLTAVRQTVDKGVVAMPRGGKRVLVEIR
jgi:hypothetical protein